jgi:hypothetical protein
MFINVLGTPEVLLSTVYVLKVKNNHTYQKVRHTLPHGRRLEIGILGAGDDWNY